MNHLDEREAVKFVLNGRSFDTASSTSAAIYRGVFIPGPTSGNYINDEAYIGAEQVRFEHTLFRTAKGAFFVHEHTTAKYPKGKPVVEDAATEMTPEEAIKWIVQVGAAVIDGTGLSLPEEA